MCILLYYVLAEKTKNQFYWQKVVQELEQHMSHCGMVRWFCMFCSTRHVKFDSETLEAEFL